MTTIITDGKTIAADSLSLMGSEPVAYLNRRKLLVRNRKVYAMSGVAGMREALAAWIDAGADPKEAPPTQTDNGGWGLIVASPGEVIYVTNTCLYPGLMKPPFSIGSGQAYALGALAAGASPRAAIAIAAQFDVNSGGEIQVIDLETLVETIYAPDGVGVISQKPQALLMEAAE